MTPEQELTWHVQTEVDGASEQWPSDDIFIKRMKTAPKNHSKTYSIYTQH